jgi:hypothetical protein
MGFKITFQLPIALIDKWRVKVHWLEGQTESRNKPKGLPGMSGENV